MKKTDTSISISEKLFNMLDKNKNLVILLLIIGIILVMEAFIFIYTTLNHWFSHLPILLLFILFSAGAIDIILIFLYRKSRGLKIGNAEQRMQMAPYLKMINRYIPISNRFISISIGLFLIASIWMMKVAGIGNPIFGDTDILLVMTGAMFILYPFIPNQYWMERDFTLTFLIFLLTIMGIIPFLFDMAGEDFIYYFLTMPLHNILRYIGIGNALVPPSSIILTGSASKLKGPIIIARSCSGIYSFSIFTSAFISFVLVVYQKIDRKSVLFLGLGIILAYIGNLLRMTIVVLSGYYYGQETLQWTHSNVGYIIFFAWMTVFWLLLYRWLMKEESMEKR